jgi:type VI protein secretion system component VasF
MEWILRIQDSSSMKSSDMPKLSETYENCRTRVDALERYAEKNDRPLIEMARELVIAVRNLDRASRTRGEDYTVQQAVQKAASELKLLARTTNEDLAVAAGDAPSEKDR